MDKIISQNQIEPFLKGIPSKNRIVLVGGCFDIIHRGHIEFLNNAKRLGDTLIVLLESDETVKKLKGKERPIHLQIDRAVVLAHISPVDGIIMLDPLLHDDDYSKLVKLIKPAIIAITKGDPGTVKKLQHAQLVDAEIKEVIDRKSGFSTTDIIKKKT